MLPMILDGAIKRYKGHGRELGYPTANIDTNTKLHDGVYFGFAELAHYSHHPALIFIGTPTTIGDKSRRVEAHLLGIPDIDYYGHRLVLDIQHYHRANKKFGSINDLIVAIKSDEQAAQQWFAKS